MGAEAILPAIFPLPEAERRGRNSLDSPLLLSFTFLPMPPTGKSQWAHVPGRYINSLQCWASEAQSNGVGVGGLAKMDLRVKQEFTGPPTQAQGQMGRGRPNSERAGRRE